MSDSGDPPPIKLIESCDRCGSSLIAPSDSGADPAPVADEPGGADGASAGRQDLANDAQPKICPVCSKYGPRASEQSARQADRAIEQAGERGEPDNLMSARAVAELELDAEITDTFQIIEVLSKTKRYIALRAYDPALKCNFILKVLALGFFDPLVLSPIETVASTLVEQSHPNLLTIYDARVGSSGRRYLIMEDPGRVTIETLISEEGFVEIPRVLNMFVQACDGLAMVHRLGLIHTAIRPRALSVIKNETGIESLKLTGFSITNYIESNTEIPLKIGRNYTCNDAFYMAPEVLRSRDPSFSTDIYSLGCVMFHAMTGKPVYRSRELEKVIAQHIGDEKARFRRDYEIPSPIQDVILHCLEKDPLKRYKSIADLRRDASRLENDKQPLVDNRWRRLIASFFEKLD
ncbi:MAG: protein kinase [Candidatus Obscuribacterales bacterium]|nr:protein kinase [Candidatus Obscuribacterales bacterium]